MTDIQDVVERAILNEHRKALASREKGDIADAERREANVEKWVEGLGRDPRKEADMAELTAIAQEHGMGY